LTAALQPTSRRPSIAIALGALGTMVLACNGGCRTTPAAPTLDSSPPNGNSIATGPAAAAPEDLEHVLASLPHGELLGASGPRGLVDAIGKVLTTIDGGSGVEVAFVVDASTRWLLGSALVGAIAAHRGDLAGGRYGLVSSRYGSDWTARTDVPLGPDAYDVQRAARHLEYSVGPPGARAAWAGLQEATHLAWAPGRHPQVILLTDDRAPTTGPASPPAPASMRDPVIAWARATGATLHAIRCLFELDDGRRTPGSSISDRPDLGADLHLLPGFFRDATLVEARSDDGLGRAVDAALSRVSSRGDADVALLVDRSGTMGTALGGLRDVSAHLDAFVGSPGHRLAMVSFGEEPARVVLPFTTTRGAVPGAIRGLRSAPSADHEKDLFAALNVARALDWKATAKSVIVLTASTWFRGPDFVSVEDWTDADRVEVTVVEPLR
jgi:hypothetical protein